MTPSSFSHDRLRPLLQVALVATAATIATAAAAEPVRGIQCLSPEPIAVRGGVLMLPLAASQPGDQWPTHITIELENGGKIDGVVTWLTGRGKTSDVHWTSEIAGLTAREILSSDDTARGLGSVVLLARLPEDASGVLRVLNRTLTPRWVSRPMSPSRWESDEIVVDPLMPEVAPHLPDIFSPFEYWRWVVLADRLTMAPPPPPAAEVDALVALYYADLWRLGLERVQRISSGVAERCREILTLSCRDRDVEFAAWESAPGETGLLLGELLDFSRDDSDVVLAALDWCDTRDLVLFWIERDWGDRVELAVANPEVEPVVAEFWWEYADSARNEREIPIGILLVPGEVTRVIVDRPEIELDQLGRPAHLGEPLLVMRWRDREHRIALRPVVREARPPGVSFAPFHSTLTLTETRLVEIDPVPVSVRTSATFRRLHGRWEIFFTCFRPGDPPAADDPLAAPYAGAPGLAAARGTEAVTLHIGPADQPTILLTVPEVGFHRFWVGANDGTMQIHRRSYQDRWYCRVVLPDSWIGFPVRQTMLLGFSRTHGDSQAVETSPTPACPWRIAPGRVEINTSNWLDLPG